MRTGFIGVVFFYYLLPMYRSWQCWKGANQRKSWTMFFT